MKLTLTEDERRTLAESTGPVRLVDDATQDAYLVSRANTEVPGDPAIAEGIRRARAALRRDLPALLADPKLRGQFVLYHLDKRLAMNRDLRRIAREVERRDLPSDEYYIGSVNPEEYLDVFEGDDYRPGHVAEQGEWVIELNDGTNEVRDDG